MFIFNENTPEAVRDILTCYYNSRKRLRIVYGNAVTGTDWLEEHDIIGGIGRSTGAKQMPLLIKNKRSHGGGVVIDHCIVRLVDVKSKKVLYQHKHYDYQNLALDFDENKSEYSVYANGELRATFETKQKARNYIDFLLCKRMRK